MTWRPVNRIQDPETEANAIPGKPPPRDKVQLHEGTKPFRGAYGVGNKPYAGRMGVKRRSKS